LIKPLGFAGFALIMQIESGPKSAVYLNAQLPVVTNADCAQGNLPDN
jgi:hypothetical protein